MYARADRMHLNGWGEFKVTHADYDELEFEITLSDSPVKEIYHKDDSCMHYFYRGTPTEFYEYLLKIPMMIKNTRPLRENLSIQSIKTILDEPT